MSNGLGGFSFTRKYIIYCSVPSTSCDKCTCKVWSYYVQQFRRRCIYKKIHNLTLTLGSRSNELLPSTFYIMWPMHQQSLQLLLPTVQEKMLLLENLLFDPLPRGQGHMKHRTVPSTSCDLSINKVGSCYEQQFMRRYYYKKGRTRTAFGTKLIHLYPIFRTKTRV